VTIFALSSGRGRAGIAVVRLSGPAAGAALARLSGAETPAPRVAALRRLRDPRSGQAIDHGLALWFPAPHSYTGEDLAELHVHGGLAVVEALIEALAALPGLRPAAPGEFTRRAYLNGKLDLTQAEAVADLVEAETEAQRRQALRQMEGALGVLYEGWRGRLLAVLAHLEADIDFPDEDLPESLAREMYPKIEALIEELTQHLDDSRRGERLREGLYVTIVGAPNVGKSSLLNALARRPAAIVAATAGTTRDVIEVHLDLGGFPVLVADTAGLREADDAPGDPVEDEGVRRALARAASADLKLAMFEATSWPEVDGRTAALVDRDTIVVINKADLRPLEPPLTGPLEVAGQPALALSVLEGSGMESFLERLEAAVSARIDLAAPPALTRARHRQALDACRDALRRALATGVSEGASELAAEDLRLAARELGRITGRVDVEDILDIVFEDFCIGK
jgi:tRNA modification GTPase